MDPKKKCRLRETVMVTIMKNSNIEKVNRVLQ